MSSHSRLLCATALFLATGAGVAGATPRALPFTYPYETLPEGALEAEQYIDMVPVRVARELPDGTSDAVTSLRSVLQTELEFGLTDRLEIALYFMFVQGGSADTPFLRFQGLKQRARYRFAEQGEWPINVGVYLELAELHNEFEFEEKILLSRRFGRVNVAANLWVEQEWYWQDEEWKFIYNPTIGATYEISPKLSIGAEYWARGRFDDPDVTATTSMQDDLSPKQTVHYAGPTILFQGAKAFISLGVYARLDQLGTGVQVGDTFGKMWIRALVGVDL